MSGTDRPLTGVERKFPDDEIIVSKTDPTGRLTYVNDVFLTVSGYAEHEVVGQPHSIIRHPEMPRAVFKLLWDAITAGREVFAYVNNRAKNGDHYWVLAHVTPNVDAAGKLIGYHSNRRAPRAEALAKIKPLYRTLLDTERKAADRKVGLDASFRQLNDILDREGKSYGEFVFGL
ncbi:MAG: PAS domain-containing protein [Bacteroidota bacterium]